ncbi:MAG: GNAT family N-acetyltransferase [Spirochaetaceae bacterium]|nr:MAG: GNAT family N-acetyltransferase [Spirochaetaceae bacterium]
MRKPSGSADRSDFRQVRLLPQQSQEALALSAEAGWNQTAEDWRIMLQHGSGVGFRNRQGELVASIVSLPYGNVDWIAMLLTRRDSRGAGLGTRLFDIALDTVRKSGRGAALDATPLGKPIYERHGFHSVTVLRRMELRTPAETHGAAHGIQAVEAPHTAALAELDTGVLGLDRRWLIAELVRQPQLVMLTDVSDPDSLLALRRGRIAYQLGPLYAGSPESAMRLTAAAMATSAEQPLFVDVPERQAEYLGRLASLGFREQREFTRMALSHTTCTGRPEAFYAMAGPEFG